MKQVALVIPYLNATQIYLGLRLSHDKSKYVFSIPGGHFKPGEAPEQAAIRELYEETLLKVVLGTLKPLGESLSPDGTRIYLFSAQVTGTPDGSKDPDQEFIKFKVVNFTKGVPADILPHLHGPPNPEDNVLVKHFGVLTEMVAVSHFLPPDLLKLGYALSIKPDTKEVVLFHLGKQIGTGTLNGKEPQITINPDHQGKGLGRVAAKALIDN